ncbi:hypothetical protein OIV83_004942 [Microbotryomycetes sp. JL201]|nr:hypothetical protein OIV83_004942 [Microbotryomycetes sp. JL201]
MTTLSRQSSPTKDDNDLKGYGEQDGVARAQVREVAGFAPLERKLKTRHITMLAIGGIIGPGLLVGSGNAIATAGPAGALIAFVITGIIVFFVMQSLGELATYAPISGSFTSYSGRYIDPALSVAVGYQYWYAWICILCNEYNNLSLLLWFWKPAQVVPEGAYIAMLWFFLLGFSFLGVAAFGEAEFWLTLIKVIAIFLFIIFAIVRASGGIGDPDTARAFHYWSDPGAFAAGISGVAKIFVVAGTLYAGCESVGVVAGESANPARAVPRAIRSVFFRIAFFYITVIFLLGILIPYDSPRLLNATSKAAASPFTIALQEAGVKAGADVMNSVIIITVISAGNSALYLASRILVGLAREGFAPRVFGVTSRRGVPYNALIFSNLFGLLALLKYARGSGSGKVFGYLMSISGVSTFIVWAAICLCHIRFRAAMKVQGRSLDELPYRALFYPYGAYFALAANVFLIFFQGYATFSPFSAVDFVISYLAIPIFVICYLGWKFYHKTHILSIAEIDLDSDRRTVERERADQGLLDAEEETSWAEKQQSRQGLWAKAKTVGSRILA